MTPTDMTTHEAEVDLLLHGDHLTSAETLMQLLENTKMPKGEL